MQKSFFVAPKNSGKTLFRLYNLKVPKTFKK